MTKRKISPSSSGPVRYVATTLFGLEDILAAELEELGGRDVWPMNRAVVFFGDKELLYKVNLWCRTAIRILWPIKSFAARDADELYWGVREINWGNYFDVARTIAVDAVVSHSGIDHSHYAALRVKDAIVDQFRESLGRRPDVDAENPDVVINLYLHQDKAILSLDASGQPLYRRGYRASGGEAPLNEVLAAAIIRLTGWDKKTTFIDAMCGSGTFVIEAALAARNIPPGFQRESYAYQKWLDYEESLHGRIREDAPESRNEVKMPLIMGSDKSAKQIAQAKANATLAGMAGDIEWKVCEMENISPPPGPGIIVMNPPYGERSKERDLEGLYQRIGDTLKNRFSGYMAFILSGNLEAAKSIGLKPRRRVKLYNGPIECRLLEFPLW